MTDAAVEAPQPEAPAQEPPVVDEPEKVDDTDWKAKAREWEKVAKQNKNAAVRLAEIEDAQKTEVQKASERLASAERERDEARIEGLRFKVAVKHGISEEDADLFLTGRDEESLIKQASRLAEREAQRQEAALTVAAEKKKQGNYVPREGATTSASEGDGIQAVRGLFG